MSTSSLKAHFGYKKFRKPPYRLLFLTSDYFAEDALTNAFEADGHVVRQLPLDDTIDATQATKNILKAAVEFKPDMILAMNSVGLDWKGQSIRILCDLDIPVVVWYLDNPTFCGPHFVGEGPELAIAFTYERMTLGSLRQSGFKHVHYLPSGTDPLWCADSGETRSKFLNDKITFVGSTFNKAIKSYYSPQFEPILKNLDIDLGEIKQQSGRVNLNEHYRQFIGSFDSKDDYYRFTAYMAALETKKYRLRVMNAIRDDRLIIFGPEGDWAEHFPPDIFKGEVTFGVDNSKVYKNSGITLSLTTFQQETALNLRYYNVPLSGGFLLSEWQDDVAELFEPEKEHVTFRTVEELRDKAAYYRKHPREKEKIRRAAVRRIMGEHLIAHRANTMLEQVKEILNA